MSPRRIGVDLGGVVIDGRGPHADTMFGENFLDTPAVHGAFAALAELTSAGHTVFIVSKCGARIENASRAWLTSRDFFALTGVAPDALRFCRRRPHKAVIAAELGLDAFVDDRWDVAAAVSRVVRTAVVFDPSRPATAVESAALVAGDTPATVTVARTWAQTLTALAA